ncbi:MAG: hypothetical protein R3A48_14595 [Polyangiales bacterium]
MSPPRHSQTPAAATCGASTRTETGTSGRREKARMKVPRYIARGTVQSSGT